MRKNLYMVVLALIASVDLNAANREYLVKDGVAQARICIPAEVSYTTMLAVEELQTYIKKISGAEIELQCSPYDAMIFRSIKMKAFILAPETVGVFTGNQDRDSFEIIQKKDKITIKSKSEAGVLFGVYSYLQNLGVRWFSPGEDGENVPKMKDIVINIGSKNESPSFWDRNIWYNGDRGWHIKRSSHWTKDFNDWWLWSLRNRMDLAGNRDRRGTLYGSIAPTRINNGHHIHLAALKGADINKSPERFALYKNRKPDKRFPKAVKVKDGYRIATDNICMTSKANIKQAIKYSIVFLSNNPQAITAPMGLGDFSGVCECDNCRAANNGVDPGLDPNTVTWKFMNKVSDEIAKVLPGKGVGFYACYGTMTHPPAGMKAAATGMGVVTHVACNAHALDNENCIYNVVRTDNLNRIQESGARIKIRAYTMWYGNIQPLRILDTIKSFHKSGAGIYSCEVMGRDELRNIVHWCMAQLLWDSSADPEELLKEYTDKYYGAAGSDVLAVLNILDERVRTCQHIVFNTSFDILQPEVTKKCRDLIISAKGKVKGAEAERLAYFDKSLEMIFRRNNVYRLQAKLNQERTPEALADAKTAFSEFKKWIADEHIFEKCSPQLLNAMLGSEKLLNEFKFTHRPSHKPDVENGTRKERIAALFTNAEEPKDTSNIFLLPDVWKFSLDLDRTGEQEGWNKVDFNDSKWLDMSVFNFIAYQGIFTWSPHFWYRTSFNAPVFTDGKKIFMRVGALDDGGTIYLNGKKVYERLHLKPNDWKTSFEFDVTDALIPGKKNIVAIRGIDHQGAAGLWRGVGLYEK